MALVEALQEGKANLSLEYVSVLVKSSIGKRQLCSFTHMWNIRNSERDQRERRETEWGKFREEDKPRETPNSQKQTKS